MKQVSFEEVCNDIIGLGLTIKNQASSTIQWEFLHTWLQKKIKLISQLNNQETNQPKTSLSKTATIPLQ